MRRRSVVLSVVVLAALAVTLACRPGSRARALGMMNWHRWSSTAPDATRVYVVPTVTIQRRSFDVTVRVPGELRAAKSEPILATLADVPIEWMVEDGAAVKPGDTVMRLNTTDLAKQVADQEQQDAQSAQQERTAGEDAKRRVQAAKDGLEKAKSDLTLTRSKGKAGVDSATAQLEQARKELEVAEKEDARNKRLAEEHLVAASGLEISADQLRSAQFGAESQEKDLAKAKQDAEVNEKVKQMEVRKAEVELRDATSSLQQNATETAYNQKDRREKLATAHALLASCEMKTHLGGLVLVGDTWDNGDRKLRAGDQVYYEGQCLARIINPDQMLVACNINENDINRVRVGQPTSVRVEALGNARLRGTVVNVDNISREQDIWEGGTPTRIFKVDVKLKDHDARLRPGMTGTAEIAVERANEELSVPAEAVFKHGDRQVVYRRQGEKFVPVPVTILRRGEMMASLRARSRRETWWRGAGLPRTGSSRPRSGSHEARARGLRWLDHAHPAFRVRVRRRLVRAPPRGAVGAAGATRGNAGDRDDPVVFARLRTGRHGHRKAGGREVHAGDHRGAGEDRPDHSQRDEGEKGRRHPGLGRPSHGQPSAGFRKLVRHANADAGQAQRRARRRGGESGLVAAGGPAGTGRIQGDPSTRPGDEDAQAEV